MVLSKLCNINTNGYFPSIIITAPTGSLVTLLNTTTGIIKTGIEISSTWTFKYLRLGTYIVSAVKGDESTTEIVNVSEVRDYNIELSFDILYLFKEGDLRTSITGGWTTDGYSLSGYTQDGLILYNSGDNYISMNLGKTSKGSNYVSMFGTVNPIILDGKYNYINYDYYCTGNTGTARSLRTSMGTTKACYNEETAYSNPTVNARLTYKLALKYKSGSYYFCLQNHPAGSNSCGYMYNVYLSKE